MKFMTLAAIAGVATAQHYAGQAQPSWGAQQARAVQYGGALGQHGATLAQARPQYGYGAQQAAAAAAQYPAQAAAQYPAQAAAQAVPSQYNWQVSHAQAQPQPAIQQQLAAAPQQYSAPVARAVAPAPTASSHYPPNPWSSAPQGGLPIPSWAQQAPQPYQAAPVARAVPQQLPQQYQAAQVARAIPQQLPQSYQQQAVPQAQPQSYTQYRPQAAAAAPVAHQAAPSGLSIEEETAAHLRAHADAIAAHQAAHAEAIKNAPRQEFQFPQAQAAQAHAGQAHQAQAYAPQAAQAQPQWG